MYKKALEIENDRKWVENSITANGETTIEIKPVWGGEGKAVLILTLVSRTLPNLKETVRSYELDGMETIHTSY